MSLDILDILVPRKSLLVSVALNRTQMTCIHEPGCKHSCWILLDAIGVCLHRTQMCHMCIGILLGVTEKLLLIQHVVHKILLLTSWEAPRLLTLNPTRPKRLFLVNLELVMRSRAVLRNETTCTNQTSKMLDKLHHRVEFGKRDLNILAHLRMPMILSVSDVSAQLPYFMQLSRCQKGPRWLTWPYHKLLWAPL